MEWVNIYLADAHKRFKADITGDLDWTLNDTCKFVPANGTECIQADHILKTTPKPSAHTRPLVWASLTGVDCSHTKSGKAMNMLWTLHFQPVLASNLQSVGLSALVRCPSHVVKTFNGEKKN